MFKLPTQNFVVIAQKQGVMEMFQSPKILCMGAMGSSKAIYFQTFGPKHMSHDHSTLESTRNFSWS